MSCFSAKKSIPSRRSITSFNPDEPISQLLQWHSNNLAHIFQFKFFVRIPILESNKIKYEILNFTESQINCMNSFGNVNDLLFTCQN